MKQIRIILKSGKEVQWETDLDPMVDIMCAEKPCGYITVADGRTIHITKDEVAAIIITPMVKCPKCGKWTIPNIERKKIYGDSESPMMQWQQVEEKRICGNCGTAIDN